MNATIVKRKKAPSPSKRKKLIFYCCLMAIPVLHFLVFYLYVNFNSIIMAFETYSLGSDGISISFAGFSNFQIAWESLSTYTYRLKNSLIFFAAEIFISTPLAILASYYIYKKKIFSGFFKVILFMPQILSSVILGVLFRYISGNVYQYVAQSLTGSVPQALLSNPDTQLVTMLVFNTIMSFGVNVLLYSNAMGDVNPSLIESAELDGANTLQQFVYIILPKIYPTIVSLFIVSISSLFTNQYQVFNIFDAYGNSMGNIGYFIYMESKESGLLPITGHLTYSALAAYGLILTAIIVPVALLSRHFLNKYGPSED